MARFRHGAFPGGNPWQFFRLMHLRGGFGRENRQFAARFARHASEMSWLWQDMRAMHPKSPANSRLGIHRAKILPGRGAFRCTAPRIMHGAQILPSSVAPNRPSARNPGAAEQCEPPELDRPTQETQPRRQRPRRLLGSKYRQQPPRYRHRSLPTPASSLSPRRTTLSSPTAPPVETTSTPPPPRRFAELRSPKGRATFPTCGACLLCSWQMRSVCKRQTEPLLRDYFVMVA